MNSISKEALQRIRKEYPVGARVELTKMNDPYRTDLVPGCKVTVKPWHIGGVLKVLREDKQFKADELSGFLFELGDLDLLDTEWKNSRFRAIVERITVYNDGRLVFTFTNGSEETVMM